MISSFQKGMSWAAITYPFKFQLMHCHMEFIYNHTRCKFDQTNREVFESTLKAALGSADFSGLTSASDLDKYAADFMVISTAVDKAILRSKSEHSESTSISNETVALIKEKHRLRRQYMYSQVKDPVVKIRIDQLQKQIKDDVRVKMQAGWENSATLSA